LDTRPSPPPQRVRTSPYISLNLLGEYMVASFKRQRTILRTLKFPKDCVGPQFDPAQKAVVRYLAGGGGGASRLRPIIDGLLTGDGRGDWFERRDKLSAQAAECLLNMEGQLKLEGLAVSEGCDRSHRTTIGGVVVSVYPDLVVRGEKGGEPIVGAMKFRYVKTKPVNAEWAQYSATILHRYVESELALEGEVAQRTLCRVVDVFAGKVYEAPGTFKARRENVEAACWHIKNSWDSITLSDR
jgi:hypothetical protein